MSHLRNLIGTLAVAVVTAVAPRSPPRHPATTSTSGPLLFYNSSSGAGALDGRGSDVSGVYTNLRTLSGF